MKKMLLFIFLIFILPFHLQAQLSHYNINNNHLDFNFTDSELFSIYSNWTDYPEVDSTGVFIQKQNAISDTLSAPYIIYIPVDYTSDSQTPLIVYLHGGVSRENFIENYISSAKANPFINYADKHDFLVLFPMGRLDLTWWSIGGMENIRQQIRAVKEDFNIDDNRVYLTGFSDGGSASFHFAMTSPCYFSSFFPMSGNLVVGSVVNGFTAALPNLANRYIRAINTDLDGLYPAARMEKINSVAVSTGADILYNTYYGIGHQFTYHEYELPKTFKSMKLNTRNPFSPSIYWETPFPDFGSCDWLVISETDTVAVKREWHKRYSLELADDRIMFGFIDDREYTEAGVRISEVTENTAAYRMGLEISDIIIAMDGINTESIEELLEIRDSKSRGDNFDLTVRRGDEYITLYGSFPPLDYVEVFPERQKTGAISARFIDNTFYIDTSRVRSFSIKIHPYMVNLKAELRVYVNGKEIFNDYVDYDRDYMTKNFLLHRDRTTVWIKQLDFEI